MIQTIVNYEIPCIGSRNSHGQHVNMCKLSNDKAIQPLMTLCMLLGWSRTQHSWSIIPAATGTLHRLQWPTAVLEKKKKRNIQYVPSVAVLSVCLAMFGRPNGSIARSTKPFPCPSMYRFLTNPVGNNDKRDYITLPKSMRLQ